jgi:hypothetical protein
MDKQFRQMALLLLTWVILVGSLGASLKGTASAFSESASSDSEFARQPDTLLEAGSAGQNFELVGHLGGKAQAVQVVGDYAYVGFGPELAVLDISDPAHIRRIGWIVAAGEVMEITVAGDYAYIAYIDADLNQYVGATGLQIVDIHNPELPVSLSVNELSDCSENESMVIQGNYIYFAFTTCSAYGGIIMPSGTYIDLLDITNPADPVNLDSYRANGLPFVNGIAVLDGWLFALFAEYDHPRMVVFDISSKVSLVETISFHTIPLTFSDQEGIAISDNYAFIAGADNLLQVVDISDPTQPDAVITYTLPGQAKGIYTDTTVAYIVLSSNSVLILDTSDPLNLVYRGTYQTTGLSQDLFMEATTAYSANGVDGFEIFDTAGLTQVGLIKYPQKINDIVFAGDYAYSTANDGFWVLDVSDPRMPFPVAYLETFYPVGSLVLKGNLAFIATPGYGIRILDISDPLQPAYDDFFYMPYNLRQLLLVDNIIYAVAGEDGLYILDISDPHNLHEISSYMRDYGINAVSVSGSYAYLATNDNKLVVLDISSPASLVEIGEFDPANLGVGEGWWGSAVSVQGNLVLFATIEPAPTPLAGYDNGIVWIVDVSKPDHPVQVGTIPTLDYGWAPNRVVLVGRRAYVLYERQGLYLYDVSDLGTLHLLGKYNPSEFTNGMSMAGDKIYLFNHSTFLVRFLDPNLPAFGGSVKHANNQPYPGVLLSAGDLLQEEGTDVRGTYAFRGMDQGTYTITPNLSGFVFSPTSREVSVPPSTFSQNFTILSAPVEISFTPGISTTLRFTDTQRLPSWLDIPSNAYNRPLTLQIIPTVEERAQNYAFAGHAFELNVILNSKQNADFGFNHPLVMTITYSPQDIAVITDSASLALWRWDGAAWQDAAQTCSPASEYIRNPDHYSISVPICLTGIYKLMGLTRQFYLPVISIGD